jgi:hypothetical protein
MEASEPNHSDGLTNETVLTSLHLVYFFRPTRGIPGIPGTQYLFFIFHPLPLDQASGFSTSAQSGKLMAWIEIHRPLNIPVARY